MKITSTAGLVLAAGLLVAGGFAAGGAGQPAGGGGGGGSTQYASLTLSNLSHPAPSCSFGLWEFEDSSGRYNEQGMVKLFGIKSSDDNRARVVSLVSAKGWELVTHTEAATRAVDIFNGNTAGEGRVFRTEQWWFRKR